MSNNDFTNLTIKKFYDDYIYMRNKFLDGDLSRKNLSEFCIELFDKIMDAKYYQVSFKDRAVYCDESFDLLEHISTYLFV